MSVAIVAKKTKFAGWFFSASIVMFVSSNFVNAGNMVFNLIFSRWMGPELFSDLAFLLTLKLSILGVLNALQFLVTERIAHCESAEQDKYIASYRKLTNRVNVMMFVCLPLLLLASTYGNWAHKIGLSDSLSLQIFFFGFPFYLPLALWRGVAQGRIDLPRIVLSANAEMLVRLLGGALFWWLGFGVSSVIFAFVLSLFAAWFVARPKFPDQSVEPASLQSSLPWRQAVPWALTQIAVIFLLDGDVFVTKLFTSAHEAGLIAAISIVQRIIFFSCFSLAAILLPQVIKEINDGGQGLRSLLPIVLLILGSSSFVLFVLKLYPELSVSILFGLKFESISPLLLRAGLSATLITISYFLIVFMMAHKISSSAYLYILLALGQLVFLGSNIEPGTDNVAGLVEHKFTFQLVSTGLILIYTIAVLSKKLSTNQNKNQEFKS